MALVFSESIDVFVMSWNIAKISRKARLKWNLVLRAICWTIWLERNHRVFKDYEEPAFNIYAKAKEIFCFWGLNCKGMEDYSAVEMKKGWGNLFCL